MLKVKQNKPKRKSKTPKKRAVKKHSIKKPLPIHQQYQESHYKTQQIHTQGFFNPFSHNTGIVQTTSPVIPHYSSGGIPYTSTLQSYGITNKPPYYLESLMQKPIEPDYQIPTKPETSTTTKGSNPMSKPTTKTFVEQTKPESVSYVDLVEPKKKGDETTQPDYVSLVPMKRSEQTLTQKEKNENRMMGNEEVGQRITEYKLKRKKEVKQNIMNRIEAKKRLRGTKDKEEL